MKHVLWLLNVLIALLSGLNTVFWGYTVREVGDPQLSIDFLIKLVFNKWFMLALASAFTASLVSYVILKEMGVLAGRFFLSLSVVAVILACVLILGERLTWREWIGIALIMIGIMLLEKW